MQLNLKQEPLLRPLQNRPLAFKSAFYISLTFQLDIEAPAIQQWRSYHYARYTRAYSAKLNTYRSKLPANRERRLYELRMHLKASCISNFSGEGPPQVGGKSPSHSHHSHLQCSFTTSEYVPFFIFLVTPLFKTSFQPQKWS